MDHRQHPNAPRLTLRRRDLIVLLGGAAIAWPSAARAQQKPLPVVGYLSIGASVGRERYVGAFRAGLADRGYVDGKNVVISFHYAGEDYSRLPQLAAELSRRHVDLIVAPQLPTALAAISATRTIPIVFLIGDDPVKHGLAASFNHPGGNATGISMLSVGLVVKRFELLRELAPGEGPIAVLINPSNQNVATQLAELNDASRTTRQPIKVFNARSPAEIEAQFASIGEARVKALVVGADPFLNNDRSQIVALAAHHAIPGVYEWRESVDIGGLASYGPSLVGVHRQLGRYAGRILKGEKPADLPVQQPTKFELVVNLKTAKALGLTVPQSILARADEVIE